MFHIEMDADKLKQFLSHIVETFRKPAMTALEETVTEVRRQMQIPGTPITYPVDWDSPKQRAAFFATDGFGGGIPHVRRDDYINGWTKTELPFGWSLSNTTPGAGAIGGLLKGGDLQSATAWQSRIHRNRWTNILPVLREQLAGLPQRIIDKFRVVLK